MLPVEAVLPDLLAALASGSAAVLAAPPGAGKTTLVPLRLMAADWAQGRRIVVVEPRRLAARAAARRMAAALGEEAGATIGYRVRNETRVSARTRVELVTAGVFVRMILDDPSLEGIAALLFDEVHERAVDTDLGLALALDAQAALRPDLRLVAMSATLDAGRFAALLDGAPVVESAGRAFPVETVHLGADPGQRVEERVARAIRKGLAEEAGSILAFLPGQAEILRTAERLEGRLPADARLAPLYGALDARDQDAAIRPAPPGTRKVVLATAIAETSLTIEGVRLVVDSGLSRRPRYDPGSGMTRLETVRVSRAAAEQRRGRAGRTGPGLCYRLWDAPQDAALAPYDRPEMLEADLAPLALALLTWGTADPHGLRWLDPPPAAAFDEAMATLSRLGARDRAGRLSAHGRRLADLPLPPRLAHMVLEGAGRGEAMLAAEIAAVLTEPGLGGRDTDLTQRLDAFRRDRSPKAAAARRAAARWAKLASGGTGAAGPEAGAAGLLALAYPERLAMRRGGRGRYRLASGGGARLAETDRLADEPFLAVGEVQGGGPDARILLAAPIGRDAVAALFADRLVTEDRLAYDAAADLLRARRLTRLEALVLSETQIDVPADRAAAGLLAEAALSRGLDALPWPAELAALRDRLAFLRAKHDPAWPDLSDAALAARPQDWLVPAFVGKRRLADLSPADIGDAVAALLPWQRMAELERLAPATFAAPSGRSAPIDYSSGEPVVRLPVQNLFGTARHPAVLGGALPILFELLSPAGRPLQLTRDLPGFWQGSWRDVRAEMRGRYPKHAWPEDPATAAPLAGAKRRHHSQDF